MLGFALLGEHVARVDERVHVVFGGEAIGLRVAACIGGVFIASLPGIWEKITATGLPWQVHGARALLLLMFLTICWFVRVAYQKRMAKLKHHKA